MDGEAAGYSTASSELGCNSLAARRWAHFSLVSAVGLVLGLAKTTRDSDAVNCNPGLPITLFTNCQLTVLHFGQSL